MATLSEEEGKTLVELFNKMKLKPNLDSEEALKEWLAKTGLPDQEEDKDEKGDAKPKGLGLPFNSNWPKLSNFSGAHPGKNEARYDEWNYEVKCLKAEGVHSSGAILRAIRRSTHGEAGRIVMRLGPNAGIPDILHKLDVVYGTVERGEVLLGDFYAATQSETEDVVEWSCKLEDMLEKAKSKGYVNTTTGSDEMLRTKFWLGLRSSLRDASSHKFDTCKTFDELRVELRIIEHDHNGRKRADSSKKPGHVKSQIATKPDDENGSQTQHQATNSSEFAELKGLICSINDRFTKLEGKVDQVSRSYNRSDGKSTNSRQSTNRRTTPTCWRCGQEGHLKSGCRVILDHVKDPNGKQPTPRGRDWAATSSAPPRKDWATNSSTQTK
jgi:hypothetical protein